MIQRVTAADTNLPDAHYVNVNLGGLGNCLVVTFNRRGETMFTHSFSVNPTIAVFGIQKAATVGTEPYNVVIADLEGRVLHEEHFYVDAGGLQAYITTDCEIRGASFTGSDEPLFRINKNRVYINFWYAVDGGRISIVIYDAAGAIFKTDSVSTKRGGYFYTFSTQNFPDGRYSVVATNAAGEEVYEKSLNICRSSATDGVVTAINLLKQCDAEFNKYALADGGAL